METIDLSSLNINQNININGILNHCQSLKLIKLSAFNINNIIDVNRLFNYEYAFKLEEKNILKKILKENFILGKNLNIYVELSNIIRNSLDDSIYPINMDLINNNFDIFYSILVNDYIIYIYTKEKNNYIHLMEKIYLIQQ